jgi:hypothetical protein
MLHNMFEHIWKGSYHTVAPKGAHGGPVIRIVTIPVLRVWRVIHDYSVNIDPLVQPQHQK